MTKAWDSKTNTLKITVLHNGIVEFNVSLNNKKSSFQGEKREPLKDKVQKNNNSTKALRSL